MGLPGGASPRDSYPPSCSDARRRVYHGTSGRRRQARSYFESCVRQSTPVVPWRVRRSSTGSEYRLGGGGRPSSQDWWEPLRSQPVRKGGYRLPDLSNDIYRYLRRYRPDTSVTPRRRPGERRPERTSSAASTGPGRRAIAGSTAFTRPPRDGAPAGRRAPRRGRGRPRSLATRTRSRGPTRSATVRDPSRGRRRSPGGTRGRRPRRRRSRRSRRVRPCPRWAGAPARSSLRSPRRVRGGRPRPGSRGLRTRAYRRRRGWRSSGRCRTRTSRRRRTSRPRRCCPGRYSRRGWSPSRSPRPRGTHDATTGGGTSRTAASGIVADRTTWRVGLRGTRVPGLPARKSVFRFTDARQLLRVRRVARRPCQGGGGTRGDRRLRRDARSSCPTDVRGESRTRRTDQWAERVEHRLDRLSGLTGRPMIHWNGPEWSLPWPPVVVGFFPRSSVSFSCETPIDSPSVVTSSADSAGLRVLRGDTDHSTSGTTPAAGPSSRVLGTCARVSP